MSWIWWLIGSVGLTGAAIIVAGLIVGFPTLLNFFLNSTLGRIIAALGIVALAILAAFGKGRSEGEKAAAARREAERQAAIKKRKETDAKVDTRTPAKRKRDIDKWLRD